MNYITAALVCQYKNCYKSQYFGKFLTIASSGNTCFLRRQRVVPGLRELSNHADITLQIKGLEDLPDVGV